jgi:hypothetical protein
MGKQIARVAFENGLIKSDQVYEFSDEELARSAGHSHAALIFGGNAREQSVRARKLLGWNPTRHSIYEEIPEAVAAEAKRSGIVRKY